MLRKNTFNQALKRNVTIFKWTLSLIKCLEVHLTLTKSILVRNDHLLHDMSRLCRTICRDHMWWCRDRVTTDLNRCPKLVLIFFRFNFNVIPLFSILLSFPWLNFCIILLLSLLCSNWLLECYIGSEAGAHQIWWAPSCSEVQVRQRREIKASHQFASLFIYLFFFHEETSF